MKFVAHVGEVATQRIRGRIELVGIDVILVDRILKNPVWIREYVLLSEELPESVYEISPELDGVGTVKAYVVDVGDLDGSLPPLPAPSWRGRLGRTFAAAGQGLPYMIGLRPPRRSGHLGDHQLGEWRDLVGLGRGRICTGYPQGGEFVPRRPGPGAR